MIKFNENKIIYNEDKKFCFSIPDNKIFEIDSKAEELIKLSGKNFEEIKDIMGDQYTTEDLENLLEKMKENGFLNNPQEKKYKEKNISMMTLLLVQGCNLRCSYCYAENGQYNDTGEMSEETAYKAIDFMVSKSSEEHLGICFFGGEPLLKFDLIKKIVNYCKNIDDKTFHYSMTTNGTLISKEIQEFIAENKIKVQISIDGNEKTHNYHRYFENKIGSHNVIMNKTRQLREKGMLAARATISKESIHDISENYNYLFEHGFSGIAMSPTFEELNVEDFKSLTKIMIQMYLECTEHIKQGDYEFAKRNKMFMQQLERIHQTNKNTIACGVGRYTYAIDIHGNIFPCQRFVSNKDYCLGNVLTDDDREREFLESIALENNMKCRECWVRNLCRGGCVHVNMSMTGNINSQDEKYCQHVKAVSECLIGIYIDLTKEQKEMIFRKRGK